MPQKLADGSVVYKFPDAMTDVKHNGVSVLDLLVVEAKIAPDGWGYVLVQKKLGESAKPVKQWKDGQTRNYLYWGEVQVTTS